MDPVTAAATDPLGAALHSLRMSGSFYGRSEFSAPWGVELPPMPGCLWFHAVTSGGCRLEIEGAEPCLLGAGDLALVPHGEGHRLRSDPAAFAPSIYEIPREIVSDRYEVIRHGGGGAATGMVCGAVSLDHPAADRLVGLLPKVIHHEGSTALEQDWTQSTLRLMAVEARTLRPAAETMVTRLSDILVVQAIRSWLETDPASRAGWLGALHDPQIGRAIALIHADPTRDWTVEALSRELAMSRSAFAARFTELVDEPAMGYVTRLRMQLAAGWLRDDRATVADVADRLNYRSEAAFSRAFKRVTGLTPGAVRAGREPREDRFAA